MANLTPAAKIITGVLLVALVACSVPTDTNEDYSYFMVRVDSLKAPDDFWIGDTLYIQLIGTIGSDGCKSFSHFEDTLLTGDLYHILDLTVWGKGDKQARACPAVMVMLDHQYILFPTSPGMLTITIHQPDGTTLRDYVRIHGEGVIID